ncbi:DUF6691 family protein [Thiothrix winogradskyi]|uniref:YeeE/YedE family protein n=1 Tax=Thiothrix winogradskyi TaxID=96472 RepID=A0ABY3T3E1_9GAMM|nr:DUF6691 family protein [Thiothrix winogradskyi]UJS26376.1 YeeE/YedE family protein [Thiothrix winogradskyi]
MNMVIANNMWLVFLLGIAFGYFLEGSGLSSPRKLNAQFTLRDWAVFKVMFVAIVVAAIGLWLFSTLGWLQADKLKVPTTFWWATATGGALLGAGLSLGGYCPGTSVAGLFSGRLDALFFMLGMVIGAFVFAGAFDALNGFYTAAKGVEKQTLAQLFGLPVWVVLLGLAGLAATGFWLGNRWEAKHHGVISAATLQHP